MNERKYLMAVSIINGVIMLIEEDGRIAYYRQRGINKLSNSEIANEVNCGRLNPRWYDIPELPRNYSIYYEDEEIMGKATATYELILKKKRDARKNLAMKQKSKR